MDSTPDRTLFSTSDSLGRFFGEVCDRPLRAARLLLIDALILGGLGLALGLAQFRGGDLATRALMAAGVIAYVAYWQSSHAAWLRFLMDCERPGPIPHRFGTDEIRIFALHILAVVLGSLAFMAIAIPAFLAGMIGAETQIVFWTGVAVVWLLGCAVVAGVYVARFLPVGPLMILEGAFRPFVLWREAKRLWGALVWAGVTVLFFYVGAVIIVAMISAAAGHSFTYTVGQFDLGLSEMSRAAFKSLMSASAELAQLALLLVVIVFRIVWVGVLRGIGAEAALALHAGGEPSGARAEPASPPSSATGSAPEPA